MSIFGKFLSDKEHPLIKQAQPIVEAINELENQFKDLSSEQLKQKTEELKVSLGKGQSLDDILPEAFSQIRESAKKNAWSAAF